MHYVKAVLRKPFLCPPPVLLNKIIGLCWYIYTQKQIVPQFTWFKYGVIFYRVYGYVLERRV